MRFLIFIFAFLLVAPAMAQTDPLVTSLQNWYACASNYVYGALETSDDKVEALAEKGMDACPEERAAHAAALNAANLNWTPEQMTISVRQTQKLLSERLAKGYREQ